MRVGIVGAGTIGQKRAAVLTEFPQTPLAVVADVDAARAQQLAQSYHCDATSDWQAVVKRDDVQIVIVSTVNKFLAPIAVAAAEHGKHVLCEKPLGRNVDEAMRMVEAARDNRVRLKTGFNHRHHPALWKARELVAEGALGPLMFVRCIYGHGGRPGYDKEWRGNADLAGGGELLDQGVHIVDLCRWFMGDFSEVNGMTARWFWDVAPLEDNGFALLQTADGQLAMLHSSWTQWKNRFSFEVFGRDGYLNVEGLGGSYGVEQLTWGRRAPQGGPPSETRFAFDGPDRSWHDEWREFIAAIHEQREPLANGADGLQAMRLIEAIYESARSGRVVHLPPLVM
jgi:predicted dehydrogenase